MNKTIYLVFFILISLLLLKNQDNFVNFCQAYDDTNQHCPYRVKFKDGINTTRPSPLTIDINQECKCDCDKKKVEGVSMYNNDILNGTYLVQQHKSNIISPECKNENAENKPEFIKFAGKYPVKVKGKNNNNIKVCRK